MRPLCVVLVFAFAGTPVAVAQMPPPSQQTARQALIEMFTGNAQTLEKHLPDGARKILQGGGSGSPFLPPLSNFSAGLAANRDHVQIFDAGSLLLSIEEDDGHKKMEVIVERDDVYGDATAIELSFHSYSDGLPEPLPVLPRLTFSMTQEREIWKLNEIALTLRVPLNDPEYLSGLQEKQNKAFESAAASNLRTVNTAEISYAASFPDRGFTCKLGELGGAADQPSPQHALLIDESLASGQKNSYILSIGGCDARPASRYHATAVPANRESGMRAFCTDESGVVRYAADGKATSCMSNGIPLQ
jgi:hypothetical protein